MYTQTQVSTPLNAPTSLDTQKVYCLLLNALSAPGSMIRLDNLPTPPGNMNASSYALALTLLNGNTRVALSRSFEPADILASLQRHCQTRFLAETNHADIVFCQQQDYPTCGLFQASEAILPEQSSTLIIQCESFSAGPTLHIEGPGIKAGKSIQCSVFSAAFSEQRRRTNRLLVHGMDMIFTCDDSFFCLPSATKLTLMRN